MGKYACAILGVIGVSIIAVFLYQVSYCTNWGECCEQDLLSCSPEHCTWMEESELCLPTYAPLQQYTINFFNVWNKGTPEVSTVTAFNSLSRQSHGDSKVSLRGSPGFDVTT